MTTFPSLTIEGVTIPRVICGTNALLGWSHVSPGRDAWIKEHFTPERIARVFARCIELGVTAVMGPLFPRLIEALDETEKLTGVRMTWVATTSAGMAPSGREDELAQARAAGRQDEALAISLESTAEQAVALKAAGAPICLFHGQWADRWSMQNGELSDCARFTQMIRDAGLIPGSSVHNSERLSHLAQGDYDLALLATPVNKSGWHMLPDKEQAFDAISASARPILAIKTLACGRYDQERAVPEWLAWAAAVDGVQAIALGLMVEQEAEESIPVLRDCFAAKFGE